MIYVRPGLTFTAILSSAPTGLVGTLGVRLLDPTGAIVIARTTSGIAEVPAGSGEYVGTLVAPVTSGAFIVFWDNGVVSPSTTASEELTVTASPPESGGVVGELLTDLASIRQFMQKTVSDKLQDADLETLNVQASAAIQRHCNREFAPASTAVKRSFEFEPESSGFNVIDLKPYEYRAVTTVTIDPDFTPVTLSSDQFRKWPLPSRDGTFFGLRLTNLAAPILPSTLPSSPGLPFLTRRLDVTGDWGMASIPPEVQHYANVTVESWVHLRRDGGVGQSDAQFGGEGPPMRADDLPPAVRWGLRRWVRPTAEA
jgi:hypothetical protein